MIVHIEICDVCRSIHRGGRALESFSGAGAQWDVGGCCIDKRFTVKRHTDAIKSHLLTRIEALIDNELRLMKDPL